MKTLLLALSLSGTYYSSQNNCNLVVTEKPQSSTVEFSCPDCSRWDGLNQTTMSFPKSYVAQAKIENGEALLQRAFPIGIDLWGHEEVVLKFDENKNLRSAKFASNALLIEMNYSSWGCSQFDSVQ